MRYLIYLLFALSVAMPLRADVLVLVHGYASDASTWYRSGIVPILQQHSRHTLYTPTLPAAAPLSLQSQHLTRMLDDMRLRHPGEALILVGHSAGGVVARLAVLNGNPAAVDALITIASPHLGTPRAVQGLEVAHGKPFFCPGPGIDFLKSVVGGDDYRYLRHSTGALVEMLPQGSGSLLDWANRQPHPDIAYFAVVRTVADTVVPPFSQDMNQVPALRQRVTVWPSPLAHGLHPDDAHTLLQIIARYERQRESGTR